MGDILTQLIELEVKAALGAPALLSELRNDLSGMSKARFDRDVLDLARSGNYMLIRHAHPDGLTTRETDWMIPDGEGGMYCAIIPRPEEKLPLSRRKGRPPSHLKRVKLGGHIQRSTVDG